MGLLKKYGKFLGLILGIIIISSLLVSLLSLFDFFSSNIATILNIIIIATTTFTFSFINGKWAERRGYLAGAKIGVMIILTFFLISLIFFKVNLKLPLLIYYLIILGVSIVGGMMGMSTKKEVK